MPSLRLPRRLGDDEVAELVDHLGELRARLLVSLAALAGTTGLAYSFHGRLIEALNRPLPAGVSDPITLSVGEPFMTSFKISLYAGFVLALPIFLWQFWSFIAPALDLPAQRAVRTLVLLSAGLLVARRLAVGPGKPFRRSVRHGRGVGMLRLRFACTVAGTLLLLAASACSGDSSQEASGNQDRTETVVETGGVSGTTAAASENAPKVLAAKDFDVSLFDDTSYIVDHEWFPLEPGTRYVWKGRAFDDEGQRIDRRVEFIVADVTKVIGGVRAIVGWDRDFSDDVLGESELVFYAQDKFGNVWHLGEYVEHWDGRELDGGRYWGVGSPEGARAGMQMPAEPAVGTPSYSQGFAPPPWFWQDRARVAEVGVRDCVPATGCSDDVVVTEEFEPRFPGSFQLKYYARGVGNTRVGWTGDDEEREAMVLTKFSHLSPDALAEVRARVLEQEHRGFAYGRTAPAEPLNP